MRIDELREQHLMPRSVSTVVEFSFVRTTEEYDQVLALRHTAYRHAGKVDERLNPEDMGEIYDTRSRIVIGKYHGRVIASAGLVFNEYHDRMEIEESIDWPKELPRRDEMVEVIRNCTHPSYRGSDVLMAMFRFIAITVLQAGRRYVAIGSSPDLIPLYTRIGMRDVNLDYYHRKLGGKLHKVLLGDIPQTMTGANIGPIFWNAIWSETTSYMMSTDLIKVSGIDVARMNLYRLFKPVSLLLQSRMRRPRQKR
ncbi:MAG: hypothetical protein HC809_00195 [Gammaproteobacteria bacterium]|nr:hypothetical protein [Gammaproteobacteria bacterium]